MRWFVMPLVAVALVACNTDSQSQRTVGGGAIGAAGGAAVGGAVGGWRGAGIGALAGGATGALIGRATTPNNCIYRDVNGRQFEARCP
jgi:uncharacterized protein YcfJ